MFDVPTKPECVEDMKAYLKEILPDTRAFEGCESIVVHENTDDPTSLVLYEIWASREHHEKYVQWRVETGVIQKVISMCTVDSLNPKYYELVDV